jgi:hypothetical protein
MYELFQLLVDVYHIDEPVKHSTITKKIDFLIFELNLVLSVA